jgi:hypothetical protein
VAVSLERRRGPRPAAASLFSPVAKWAWSRGSPSRSSCSPRPPRFAPALRPGGSGSGALPPSRRRLSFLFIYLHVHTLFGSFLHPAFLPHPSLLSDGFLSQPLSRLPAWRRVGPERERAAAARDSALVRIRGCPAAPPMRHRRLPYPRCCRRAEGQANPLYPWGRKSLLSRLNSATSFPNSPCTPRGNKHRSNCTRWKKRDLVRVIPL